MGALKEYKIAFMGQTRRGKSTLLNAIFKTTFKIETIVECTTNINSATFVTQEKLGFDAITVMDTPGIGASLESQNDYDPYYSHVFAIADCIVWVTNMQRTDGLDQKFFKRFANEIRKDINFIVCINGIDKFSPHDNTKSWDNLSNQPYPVLLNAIMERKQLIHERLDKILPITTYQITCTNALTGYGLNELKQNIMIYGK